MSKDLRNVKLADLAQLHARGQEHPVLQAISYLKAGQIRISAHCSIARARWLWACGRVKLHIDVNKARARLGMNQLSSLSSGEVRPRAHTIFLVKVPGPSEERSKRILTIRRKAFIPSSISSVEAWGDAPIRRKSIPNEALRVPRRYSVKLEAMNLTPPKPSRRHSTVSKNEVVKALEQTIPLHRRRSLEAFAPAYRVEAENKARGQLTP
jgi:hypothetical protein